MHHLALLVAAGACAAAVVAAAAVGFLALRRAARRLRRRVLDGAAALAAVVLDESLDWVLSGRLAMPAWCSAQRDRLRLRRAVTSAGRAVTQARSAGVPVGDLWRLCTDLRHAATDVDRALAASAAAPSREGTLRHRRDRAVRGELEALLGAADEIHQTAIDALHARSASSVALVAASARTEAAACRAGLAAVRD